MTKIKVTKRPGEKYVLHPSRPRMFVVYTVILALALGVGFLIRYLIYHTGLDLLQTDGLFFLGLILFGAVLITLMEYSRWTLHVESGENVEGPSGALGERLAIPLDEIDWKRTRRSLASWLKFGNAIYASPRQRILVSPWFFDPKKFREFLTMIGYDRK